MVVVMVESLSTMEDIVVVELVDTLAMVEVQDQAILVVELHDQVQVAVAVLVHGRTILEVV